MSSRDQIEGRNPVVECLVRKRRKVHRILLDRGARADAKVSRLLAMAAEQGVSVERVERTRIDRMCDGRVHNGVVALADPLPSYTTRQLLDHMFESQQDPFLVLADEVNYEHNLGAILRSGLGFGLGGLVLPTRRGAAVSPVVQRVSMGAAEVVPIVREGLSAALKPIRKAGIRVIGADMGGTPIHELNLQGSIALVVGGEGKGLSPTLRKRCDAIASVPIAGDLESLNVSVATAIIMYEKRRQDGWFA